MSQTNAPLYSGVFSKKSSPKFQFKSKLNQLIYPTTTARMSVLSINKCILLKSKKKNDYVELNVEPFEKVH